jgi:hypothetical protein
MSARRIIPILNQIQIQFHKLQIYLNAQAKIQYVCKILFYCSIDLNIYLHAPKNHY